MTTCKELSAYARLPQSVVAASGAGKRYLRLRPAEIDHYLGERGLRGRKLPRGFQQVRGVEIE